MPNLLSNLFADDGGSTDQTNSQDAVADGDLDMSPSIDVDHHAGGTYDNPVGSSGTWASDTHIGVTADVDAVLGAAVGGDETTASDG